MSETSNKIEIVFTGGICKLVDISLLIENFKKYGFYLNFEKVIQESLKYRDYFQNKEAVKEVSEIDREKKNSLVFSGNEKTFLHLKENLESGKLSKTLKVKVIDLKYSINLSEWFKGVFEFDFQDSSSLIYRRKLAYNLRNFSSNKSNKLFVSGAKIIHLDSTINQQQVILVIEVICEGEDKRKIIVRLFSSGTNNVLPPNLKLIMFNLAGKIRQQVESRSVDNFIQLLPFKSKIGNSFNIQVKLNKKILSKNIFII
ncbi:MAG: DUF1822 family protein [Prochloraceae cyanobacterium]